MLGYVMQEIGMGKDDGGSTNANLLLARHQRVDLVVPIAAT